MCTLDIRRIFKESKEIEILIATCRMFLMYFFVPSRFSLAFCYQLGRLAFGLKRGSKYLRFVDF